jgi:hypothetical protein
MPMNSTAKKSKIETVIRDEYPTLWLALYHHVTHKGERITFENHEYLRALYMDECPEKVVKKSTQCGVSEWLIAVANGKAGLKGMQIFYVLPDWLLHSRFVKNRYDTTTSKTPLYNLMVMAEQELSAYQKESLSLKKMGKGTIAFASSNSEAAFTEFPADMYIIDEWDECNPDNLAKADERLSHSDYRYKIKVGNPKIEECGIDAEFLKSDGKEWAIRCSRCGKYIFPDFFKHVVREVDNNVFVLRDNKFQRGMRRDIHAICHKCEKPFDRFIPGLWVRQRNSDISGYHISKMFSTKISMRELVALFDGGLINDFKMQRFYNGHLGLAYTSKGAKIDRDMLNECRTNYMMPDSVQAPCVIGIDVGQPFMHVIICQIHPEHLRTVFIGTVREPEDIFDLAKKYNIMAGVIDAMPETRMARNISRRLKNMCICYYGGTKGENIQLRKKMITVDRTQALDAVKESVLTHDIILPANAQDIPDFYDQITVAVRVYDEEKEAYSWTEGTKPDHYHHALAYALLARRLLLLLKRK